MPPGPWSTATPARADQPPPPRAFPDQPRRDGQSGGGQPPHPGRAGGEPNCPHRPCSCQHSRQLLDRRDAKIIVRRFGLRRGSEPLTLAEISSELGVTKAHPGSSVAGLGQAARQAVAANIECPALVLCQTRLLPWAVSRTIVVTGDRGRDEAREEARMASKQASDLASRALANL